tara:strand:+ start:233 stop:814 length:582 start_codon:yes stop_codon:yes gene_type:complete
LKKNNIIIIPARGNSKRLKNKNLLQINKRSLIEIACLEAKKSKFFGKIYVSSEDIRIQKICKKLKINFIKRPKHLSKDNVEKQEIIVHVLKTLLRKKLKISNVVSLQPNSPQFKSKDLDKAYIFFRDKLYLNAPIKELISVNHDNIQNACFRIMTLKAAFQKTLSTKIGIFFTDYIDINNKKDFLKVKKILEK